MSKIQNVLNLRPEMKKYLFSILFIFPILLLAQQGNIYLNSTGSGSAAILDPGNDDYITNSGSAFSSSITEESEEFDANFITIYHANSEPAGDLQTGANCGPTEIVDNPNTGQHAAYFRLANPDGINGNGDEQLVFRMRIASNPGNASYGYSILIDTDESFGNSGSTADPNYVSGNPGFEIEILYASGNSGGVKVNDVDGESAPNNFTQLASYPTTSHHQRSYAKFSNCNGTPVFLDFYIDFDDLGISFNSPLRICFASASSGSSALGGSASDIGGVDDDQFSTDDAAFVSLVSGQPTFTFGSLFPSPNLNESDSIVSACGSLTIAATTSHYSMDFDGVNDYITLSNNTNSNVFTNTSQTIETWFKTTDTEGVLISQNSYTVGTGAGYYVPAISLRSGGKIHAEIWNVSPWLTTTAYNDNQWHHVALAFSGSSVKFYIDGTLYGTHTGTINTSGINYLHLGTGNADIMRGFSANGWNYYDGLLAEVRVWNYERSAAQIAATYDQVVYAMINGLKTNLTFPEGSGSTTVNNSTLTSYTLSNGPTFSNTLPPVEGLSVGPYTYAWSNSATGLLNTVNPSSTTIYYVTISDASSNTWVDSIVVSVDGFSFNSSTLAGCFTNQATIDAGSGWSAYSWSSGQSTQQILASASGTYTVTVTSSNGCTFSDNISVTFIDPDLAQGDTVICPGQTATIGYESGGGGSSGALSGNLANGLVCQYLFTGNADNYLGTGNNGVAANVTLTTDRFGNANSAYSFNGSNSYIRINRPVQDDFTIAYWMKTTQTAGGSGGQWYGGCGIVDAEVGGVTNDFGTALNGNKVSFGTGSPDLTMHSTTVVNDGSWHFVVATRQKSTGQKKLYVDGVLQGTTVGGTQSLSVPTYIKFGSLQTNINYYNGLIDDVHIYNRVLTAAEVAQLELVGGVQYVWSNSATTNQIDVSPSAASSYYVTITSNDAECYDTIDVNLFSPPSFSFNEDSIQSCSQSTISLDGGSGWAQYAWSNGASTQSINVSISSNYALTITDNNGCTGSDTLAVGIIDKAARFADTIVCPGQSITIGDGIGGGNAAQFSSGDFLRVANLSNYSSSTNFTISTWVKTTTSANVVIAQQSRNASDANTEFMLMLNNGKIRFWDYESGFGYNNVESNSTVNNGEWNHIAFVKSGTTGKFYINGQLDATVSGSLKNYGSNDFVLGKDYRDNNGYFVGQLDEFFYWQSALTAGEIVEAYNGGIPQPKQAILWYDFEYTTASWVYDASASNNNATNSNTEIIENERFKFSYLWSTGDTTSTLAFTPDSSDSYLVTISDRFSTCNDTVSVTLVETAPEVYPGNLTIYLNNDGIASLTAAQLDSASTDSCGIDSMWVELDSFNCTSGAVPVKLYVRNNWGAIDSASAIVTVADTVSPVVATNNLTIYLDSNGQAVLDPNDVNNNSSDNCGIDSLYLNQNEFDCSDIYEFEQGQLTALMTVDNQYTIYISTSNTIEGTSFGSNSDWGTLSTHTTSLTQDTTYYIHVKGTDAGGIEMFIGKFTLTGGFVFANGTQTLYTNGTEWKASNTAFGVSESNAYDYAPNGSGPWGNFTALSSNARYIWALPHNTSGGETRYFSAPIYSNASGTASIELTAIDNSGNTATASAQISVLDTLPPVVVTQNINAYLNSSGQVTISANDVDNGTEDNCGINSMSLNDSVFDCSDTGNVTVTMTVTDFYGNTSTDQAVVTVLDTISPNAVAQNLTIYLNSSGSAIITAAQVNNGSSDNCSIASMSISETSFSCSDTGQNTISLTVTDYSGNSTVVSAIITVLDTTSPTVSTLNYVIYLDANGEVSTSATAADNGTSDNCGLSGISLSQVDFDCSDIGANSVMFTAEDYSGNISTAMVTITVADTTSPDAIAQNLTLYLNSSGQAATTAAAVNNGSSDNCTISSMSISQTTFDCNDLGSNNIVLTCTDQSSNASTASAVITVLDTNSPNAVAQNLTIYLSSSGSASITAAQVNNGSSDNCSISSMSLSQTAFDCSDLGVQNVTLTVVDQSNNISTASATITVIDNINPNATAQNITVYLDNNGAYTLTSSEVDNGSSDNCSVDSLAVQPSNFNCSDTGAILVTLQVWDQSGNSDNDIATVTVLDTVSPLVVTNNFSIQFDSNGLAQISVNDVDSIVYDACGIDTMYLDVTTFDCSNSGNNTVYLTVIDHSGNTTIRPANIFVFDLNNPVPITRNLQIFLDTFGVATITAQMADSASYDDCGIDTLILSQYEFNCSHLGSNTVSFYAYDGSGNSDSVMFTVEVFDTIRPHSIAQDIVIYLDGNGQMGITAFDLDNNSYDNCGIDSIFLSNYQFTCSDTGNNSVWLYSMDASGNIDSVLATVAVVDTISPSISLTTATVYLDSLGQVAINTQLFIPQVSDNCGVEATFLSDTIINCAYGDSAYITFFALDQNGNLSQTAAKLYIKDTISPELACPASFETCDSIADYESPIAADACGVSSIELDSLGVDLGEKLNLGRNEISFTAYDNRGNKNQCSFVITRNIIPKVYLPNDTSVYAGEALTPNIVYKDASIYYWTPDIYLSSDTVPTPIITPFDEVIYTIRIISDNGCEQEGEYSVAVLKEIRVYQAFSPNGDGNNDVFYIQGINQFPDCQITIVNRYGLPVFESVGYESPWDGTYKGEPMPVGSYFYVINLGDGSTPVSGTISIIR